MRIFSYAHACLTTYNPIPSTATTEYRNPCLMECIQHWNREVVRVLGVDAHITCFLPCTAICPASARLRNSDRCNHLISTHHDDVNIVVWTITKHSRIERGQYDVTVELSAHGAAPGGTKTHVCAYLPNAHACVTTYNPIPSTATNKYRNPCFMECMQNWNREVARFLGVDAHIACFLPCTAICPASARLRNSDRCKNVLSTHHDDVNIGAWTITKHSRIGRGQYDVTVELQTDSADPAGTETHMYTYLVMHMLV